MSMKLMSVIDKKDAQQKEQTLKILRAQETEELAKKANQNLAKANADFQSTLALNRSKWALELEEKQKLTDDMDKEVKSLEERKKQALIPISLYKEEADKIYLEAKDFLTRAKDKEQEADFLQEKLEEKLTAVADRETMVAKVEKQQELALIGIDAQREITKKGANNLYQETLSFQQRMEHEESSLLERKKEVSMAEISFTAKTEKHKRDLEALKIWELQLIDREETLKRSLARKG